MKLTIVGTIAFDSIITPYREVDQVIGGAATYAGWAASYLCQDIGLVSIIGEDWPDTELKAMKSRGMDTRGVKTVAGGKSFYWKGEYDQNMIDRTTLITELNVLDDFDPVLPEDYRQSDFLMLGNLTPKIQMQVLNQMEKRPVLIAMDTMNFWIDIARDELQEVIDRVDVLSINDEEARLLTKEYNLVKAAEKIIDRGLRYLIIKKGEHGSLLFSREDMFYAPALPLGSIVDPTGAGDSFAGGFMGYLASQGKSDWATMKKALIYGAAMGSFCVEDFSLGRLQTLNSEMIRQRVRDLSRLTETD